MFHKRLLKEFSDNRKYVAGMVIMQWAALLANVALMYVLAAYVGRISGIVKGESLTTSPSDGVLLIVFEAAPVSYTHLSCRRIERGRSWWSPDH